MTESILNFFSIHCLIITSQLTLEFLEQLKTLPLSNSFSRGYYNAISRSISLALKHAFQLSFTVLVRYRSRDLYLAFEGKHLRSSCQNLD